MTDHHSTDSSSTFDVDAWLSAAQPPQRSVTVFGRSDLVAQLEDLVADRAAAHDRTAAPATHGPDDPRLGSATASTAADQDVAWLDARISQIRETLDGSRLTLHLRALLNTEREELVQRHGGPDALDKHDVRAAYEHAAVALALVSPAMTAAQTARLRRSIGEAQWASIGRALERASSETIDVPLSRLG